jgi:hypothetical protein
MECGASENGDMKKRRDFAGQVGFASGIVDVLLAFGSG